MYVIEQTSRQIHPTDNRNKRRVLRRHPPQETADTVREQEEEVERIETADTTSVDAETAEVARSCGEREWEDHEMQCGE